MANLLTRTHLSRRAALKGVGATVALPFFDAMMPAAQASSRMEAVAGRTRLVAIEIVHGSAGSTQFGLKQHLWSPALSGSRFDLEPTSLAPLEPYRDHL